MTRTAARIRASTRYEVDMDACGPMVLDALIKIKNEIDPTLTFRRSCREGICGSCAMNIDGTQRTRLHQRLRRRQARREDLPAAAPAGDQGPGGRPDQLLRAVCLDQALAADPDAGAAGPRAAAVQGRPGKGRPALGVHPVRLLLDLAARAIGGTATAISGRRRCWPPIAGSSTAATRRPASVSMHLEDPFRLYRCHTIMNCTEACPKDLNPAKAIAEIKQILAHRGQ